VENNQVELLFGKAGLEFVPFVDQLANVLTGHQYTIVPLAEIESLEALEAIKTMWTEILYRSHWAASTSILRTHRWVHAALNAATAANYIEFSSSLRGFLESGGDTFDGLKDVATTLAEHSSHITKHLNKEKAELLLISGLEEKLIHFTHARRLAKSHSFPEYHEAKPTTEYIRQLQELNETVVLECYSELCQITHPAALSLSCFLDYDGENLFILRNNKDLALITDLCRRYSDVINKIFHISVNAPMLILKVLNRFPVPGVATPNVELIDSEAPAWLKIEKLFKESSRTAEA